jgi:hypothetical protein
MEFLLIVMLVLIVILIIGYMSKKLQYTILCRAIHMANCEFGFVERIGDWEDGGGKFKSFLLAVDPLDVYRAINIARLAGMKAVDEERKRNSFITGL